MTNAPVIREILAQYKKHGWTLRRVLLCAQTRESLANALEILPGDVSVISSETDAAWFSRSSEGGREAWELRRLSGAPFALIEVFEEEDDETVREEARFEIEQNLINAKR